MTRNHTSKKEQSLPQLSHLQFAVLEVLGTAVSSGKDLRKRLSERGIKKSGPSFYQMMARLEEAEFVEGWYSQEIVEGQIIKERQYRILADGSRALRHTKQYYNMGGPQTIDMQPAFA